MWTILGDEVVVCGAKTLVIANLPKATLKQKTTVNKQPWGPFPTCAFIKTTSLQNYLHKIKSTNT